MTTTTTTTPDTLKRTWTATGLDSDGEAVTVRVTLARNGLWTPATADDESRYVVRLLDGDGDERDEARTDSLSEALATATEWAKDAQDELDADTADYTDTRDRDALDEAVDALKDAGKAGAVLAALKAAGLL